MRAPRWFPLALGAVSLLAAFACGGGGGPSTTTVALYADPEMDGVVDVSGFIAFSPSRGVPTTGDYGASFRPDYFARQLYAFYLGPVPRSARIVRATLRIYQAHVVGEPYAKNGDVVVDLVDYFAEPGAESYDGQTLERDIGTLSTSPSLGWRSLDVTSQVAGNLAAGALWSQYRLRFWAFRSVPPDDENDFVYFTDAEDSGVGWNGEPPELVVEYE